jgi:hypothetical protein
VTSQTIWGTDARYLNDTSELSYVNTVVAQVANQLLEQYSQDLPRTFLEAASMRLLDSFLDWFQVYVAWFCADGDQLSQWRGYPAGDVGYAVGFQPEPMRRSTCLRLRRVLYDTDTQAELVGGVLAYFSDWLANISGDRERTFFACQTALHETVHILSECVFCFKHPGFREEQEWRLVKLVMQGQLAPDDAMRFRNGSSGLVPYLELHPNGQPPGGAGLLPIISVVAGPNPYPELAANAARRLLASADYGDDVTVRNSEIPLRA